MRCGDGSVFCHVSSSRQVSEKGNKGMSQFSYVSSSGSTVASLWCRGIKWRSSWLNNNNSWVIIMYLLFIIGSILWAHRSRLGIFMRLGFITLLIRIHLEMQSSTSKTEHLIFKCLVLFSVWTKSGRAGQRVKPLNVSTLGLIKSPGSQFGGDHQPIRCTVLFFFLLRMTSPEHVLRLSEV